MHDKTVLAVVLPLALALAVAPAAAQGTATVTAGPEYRASGTLRTWFGDGYRDLWTTPLEVPVLDLSTEGGGLQPVRQVGNLQTAGLAMRGADGKSYTFRSLHKEPERLLPEAWRNSWPARLVRDATSHTHPGAAVVLPVLAQAAGIPHTQPRLVVMPDDPRLGEFRATFAKRLGTFEEFPTAGEGGRAGFGGATEIISTTELWTRWLESPENRIDTRAFLRARILDLFVDNYDRRRGQWRWMRMPGARGWQPLPEDPDMAFVRHDGVAIAAMRGRQPRLLEFSDEYTSRMEGPTSNAAEVDRWLLTDLDAAVFEAVARELQAAWTDEVIARAVAQLPKEWQAHDDGFLAGALRARREALLPYVRRFYDYLAEEVDVHLSNAAERVVIEQAADGATRVTAAAAQGTVPFYDRTFRSNETDEVRVYLHGGNDQVDRAGEGGSIAIRLVAAGGEKTVQSPRTRTEVWPDGGRVTGERVKLANEWRNPQPVADAPWLEPRNYGGWTLWQPAAWFAPDVGLVVGASIWRTEYGFRTEPAAREQAVRGGWSFGESSGKLEYDGVFKRAASNIGFDVHALASGIEQINFFGLGNDTPEQSDRARYRSEQTVVSLAPAVRIGATQRWFVTAGPEIRYSHSGDSVGSLLLEQAPYGTGGFTSVAFRTRIETDSRPPATTGVMAVALGEASGDTPDPGAGPRIRTVASAFVAPAAWDVQETYGGVDGYVAAYVGGESLQLATRVGGQRLFGTYPWFDAAFLGGRNNRGFRSHRFAGDASLYGNVELRAYLGSPVFASVFPVRFGMVGFVDAGRVWLEGTDSNEWHPSAGGGVLMKPVGTSLVLRAVLARSEEGTLLYAGSGFRF